MALLLRSAQPRSSGGEPTWPVCLMRPIVGGQVITEISASRNCRRTRFSRPYPRGLKKNMSSGHQTPTHTSTHPVVPNTRLVLPAEPTRLPAEDHPACGYLSAPVMYSPRAAAAS